MFLLFIISERTSMAESVSSGALRMSVSVTSHKFEFHISTDNVEVARELLGKEAASFAGKTESGTLGVLYEMLRPLIDGVVKRSFGGERDGQRDPDIKPGSLRVLLHCLTDERFLEVLEDYESGKMKERLQEEFSKAGIKVTGLKVEIGDIEEVNKTKEAINKRYYYICFTVYNCMLLNFAHVQDLCHNTQANKV